VCEVLNVGVSGARKPLFLGRPRRSQLRIVVEGRIRRSATRKSARVKKIGTDVSTTNVDERPTMRVES